MLDDVIAWLTATRLHDQMQVASWAVPAVQTVHILAICVVVGASLMLNLRMVGVVGRDTPLLAFGNRYLPYILPALVVLLLSGATLVTAEPERDLLNQVFWIKMALVLFAALSTMVIQFQFHRNWEAWQRPRRVAAVRLLGGVLLVAWVLIIFCGRWIAYT